MYTIELENITKSFNHHVAVDDLSLGAACNNAKENT
jgi:ABC-type sugar transport system ATPase subunit